MEQLKERLADAFSGLGSVVMVVGEAGIGKTRLLQEFATYARLRGAQVLWGAAFGLVYLFLRRASNGAGRTAWVLGGLVVSHWILDWAMHRRDLPLTPWSNARYGLGLWNSLPATVLLECGLLAIGLILYLQTARARSLAGNLVLWSLIALLVAGWVSSLLAPPPPTERAVALGSLIIWLTVPWAAWADRHRTLAHASE